MPGPLGSLLVLALAIILARADKEAPLASFAVSEKFPHQTQCFTEGLFLNGSRHEVFESCGLYGRSYLRKYDLKTGTTLQIARVPSSIFSEGLALLGERLFMLTYRSHEVLEFDVQTFALKHMRHRFPYGEGWGLTTDGCDLLATTGSAFIYRLRPDSVGTLKLVEKVQVTHRGKPVVMLNEIEYITPKVWINQWHTNTLWRVDPSTGICEVRLGIGGLHRWRGEATPNGIAYSVVLDPGMLLVTGKQWPQMFGLRLSQRDLCGGAVPAAPACPRAAASACWQPRSLARNSTPGGEAARQPEAVRGEVAAEVATEASVPSSAPLRGPAQPLPGSLTAVSLALAAMLAVAAMAAPVFISLRRQHYKLAVQRAEADVST